MAEKKIFTSLAFQSGAKLVAPKVEIITPETNLTQSASNNNYYTGSAGQLAYNNGNIWVNNDSIWTKLLNHATTATISGEFTFDRVSNNVGQAPFVIGSNSSSVLVTGLNADKLDGYHARNALNDGGNHSIPRRDSNNQFHVGIPTEDTHVVNKKYADTVAQGLSIKTAVRCATTEDIIISSALNAGDSIDGVTLANGDRVLVKDLGSDYQHNNGVYIVGASPARATDYDAASEINDGDFFFVQEGSTNGNKGFVQTKNITTLGTDKIIFEQFSEAGNLEVYSQSGTAAASKTSGPLIQVGNDVTFGYNATYFDLDANNNLQLKAASGTTAGIPTGRIQDDAVTPAKLDDDGSFTMGGLTIDTSNPSIILDKSETGGGSLRFYNAGVQKGYIQSDASEELVYYQPSGLGHVFYGGGSPALKVNYDGRIGIGADASSPSGTLHVSTARYGSELFNSSARVFTGSSTYGWVEYGSNSIANVSNTLAITYSNNAFGAYVQLKAASDLTGDLVVGRRYRLTVDAYYTGGSSGAKIQVGLAGSNIDSDALTTSSATYTINFTADTATGAVVRTSGMGTGNVVTIDNLSLVEDSLASATGSDFAVADDLVINNGLTQAGMTLLGSGGARIHFGESGKEAHSRIIGTYNSDKDSSLFFAASNDGTAATVMTLYGNDKSAKFEGGVGIGMAVATAQLLSIKGDNKYIGTWAADGSQSSVLGTDSNGDGNLKLYDNAGGTKIYLYAEAGATNYFNNGGNVAIGQTSASNALDVQGGTTNTAIVARSSDAKAQISLVDNGTTGVGSVVIGAESDDLFLTAGSGGAEAFRIKSDGTQDHKGNSIVNSATVAGLQDGACYDFDGTDDYIELGSIDAGDTFTFSCWFKTTTTENFRMFVNVDGATDDNPQLRISGGKVQMRAYNRTGVTTSADYNDGKWHHAVGGRNGSNKFFLYVDGVDQGTANWTQTPVWGTVRFAKYVASSTYYYEGEIRDVKIFPSELDAADIRKLYSGENPKKNLNVELVSSFDFTNWGVSNSSNVTLFDADTVVISQADSWWRKELGLTGGKSYVIRVAGTKNADVDLIIKNYNSAALTGATTITGSGAFDSTQVITLGSGNTGIMFQAAGSAQFDFTTISIKEVETLVDFTPQSASSTKWRNEAIPSLYDGTVNNATLSQGNTYWNNIKQDGADVEVQGTNLIVDSDSHAELKLDAGSTSLNSGIEFQVAGVRKGVIRYDHNATDTSANLDFYTGADTSTSAFKIQGDGNVKVTDKLGVGGAAATGAYSILCHGGSVFEDTMRFGDENGSKGFLGWNNIDSSPAQPGAHNHFRIGASKNATNAGISFITRNNGDVDAGVITREGHWGIGTNTPSGSSFNASSRLLHIYQNSVHGAMLRLQSSSADLIAMAGNARSYFGNTSNHPLDIYTNNAAVLSIGNDGTQDHKGNRIVNSQTVNDSWRSSEPSLRFDGSGDRVSITSGNVITNKLTYDVTLSVWYKPTADNYGTYNRIVSIGGSGSTDRALQLMHVSGSSNLVVHINNSTSATISSTKLTLNKWYHIVVTYDGATVKTYVDGVAGETDSYTNVLNSYSNIVIGGEANNDTYTINGEIKDVRIHNRALDADEIKGYYNGESTPWLYANTPTTERITTGDFSSTGQPWDWQSGWSHSSSNLNMAWDGTSSGPSRVYQTPFTTADAEKKFRVTFTIGGDTAHLWIGNADGNNAYGNGNYTNYAVGTHSVEFTLPSGQTTFAFYANTNTGAHTLDDVSIVQIGEVAAYTPQSIDTQHSSSANHKWLDITSNANHGSVTGAVSVGDNDHRGLLRVYGNSIMAPTYASPNYNGTIQLGNTNNWCGRLEYNAKDNTEFRIDNTWHSNANAAITTFGMRSSNSNNRLPVLKLVASGAVEATSATSTNLKQVARVHTDTITIPASGDARATVTHNLGTSNIVLSVKESSAPYEDVEVHWKAGTHTDSQTGNKATIYFASNPSSDTNYTVAIIG